MGWPLSGNWDRATTAPGADTVDIGAIIVAIATAINTIETDLHPTYLTTTQWYYTNNTTSGPKKTFIVRADFTGVIIDGNLAKKFQTDAASAITSMCTHFYATNPVVTADFTKWTYSALLAAASTGVTWDATAKSPLRADNWIILKNMIELLRYTQQEITPVTYTARDYIAKYLLQIETVSPPTIPNTVNRPFPASWAEVDGGGIPFIVANDSSFPWSTTGPWALLESTNLNIEAFSAVIGFVNDPFDVGGEFIVWYTVVIKNAYASYFDLPSLNGDLLNISYYGSISGDEVVYYTIDATSGSFTYDLTVPQPALFTVIAPAKTNKNIEAYISDFPTDVIESDNEYIIHAHFLARVIKDISAYVLGSI